MVKKKKGPLTAKEQERKRLLSLGRNSKKELRQEADS